MSTHSLTGEQTMVRGFWIASPTSGQMLGGPTRALCRRGRFHASARCRILRPRFHFTKRCCEIDAMVLVWIVGWRLALQLRIVLHSESIGLHDSEVVDDRFLNRGDA